MSSLETVPAALWDASVPQRFRESVRCHADRLAVRAHGRDVTYAELDAEANGIAHAVLAARGPGEEPIAVLLDKSARLVAAFLGILAAGKAIVPLNPSYPKARLARICATSGAPLVVTEAAQREVAGSLGLAETAILDVDSAARGATSMPPAVAVPPATLATILYTSGSTGEPKGVAQDHRAVTSAA